MSRRLPTRSGHIHLSTFASGAADQSRHHSDDNPARATRSRPVRECARECDAPMVRRHGERGRSNILALIEQPADRKPLPSTSYLSRAKKSSHKSKCRQAVPRVVSGTGARGQTSPATTLSRQAVVTLERQFYQFSSESPLVTGNPRPRQAVILQRSNSRRW
jgi:hypothetical protein